MTIRRATIYAVVLLAATFMWLFTHSGKAQIRRVFTDIERLAAKTPNETVMECAGKAQAIARHFKDRCTIIDLGHGLKESYSREDIAGGLLAFRSVATKISIAFRELEIHIDGHEALVEGSIDYSGTEAAWPEHGPKSEKFIANLEKYDGQWHFSRIKVP